MVFMHTESTVRFNVLFEYPTRAFGQPTDSIFMISEVGEEIRPMINANSTLFGPITNALDFLEKTLETIGLLPAINEFHPADLLGELVINLKEFGLNVMLTYPLILLLTLLVYKLKDRLMVYQSARTPLPSNIENNRQPSS